MASPKNSNAIPRMNGPQRCWPTLSFSINTY